MAFFRTRPQGSLWRLGVYLGATAVAAWLGSSVTRPRRPWYLLLSKPPGQPPPWVFAPVWTALYGLMAVSAFRVFRAPPSLARERALRLWWTQLTFNGAWSPIFFGAHRPRVALADLTGTIISTASYVNTARKVDRPAAWMMAPYLAWLGFSGYLNGAIVLRNPRQA